LFALVLAFSGCYLVVGGYNLNLLKMNCLGIMGGLTSALCMACYTLLGERGMHRYRPETIIFYALAFAAITWHILYPPFHYLVAGFSSKQWCLVGYICVFGPIIPFGVYFLGVNYIRSTRAIITVTLEPISAGVMAFFLLGEALEFLQVLGGILVISAIVLLQVQQEQHLMSPEAIRSQRKGERIPGT
jgi:drug/metabolite transporter (DMT)-like permease